MIEAALAFVMSRIDHEVGEPGRNGSAKGTDELPVLAVREAIVNAVCHRDYSDNGSVQVMLFRNRLEIINPGPLPKGWTVERLLRTHDSKARNLVLAQALNWAGYVEKSGNGTEAIVSRCIQCGLQTPEYHPDNADFKIVIWRRAQSGHSRGTVRAQSGHSQGAHRSPRERCLELLTGGEMRRKEIAAALGYPNQSGYLNRLLRELVSDCLIERTLPGKPNSSQQRYRLTEKAIKVLDSISSQISNQDVCYDSRRIEKGNS